MIKEKVVLENVAPEEAADAIIKKLEEWHVCFKDMPSSMCADNSDFHSVKNAKILVAGGRGIGTADYFEVLKELANILNGEISSSRANVDAGWVGVNRQVGQTSNIVSPELYLALGISGTPQHLAGIKGAKHIIAINKRKDAPIFSVAELCIVADLHEVVPVLISKLKNA